MKDTILTNLTVINIVSSIEAETAGTTYAVVRLAESVSAQGNDVSIFSLDELHGRSNTFVADRRFKIDLFTIPFLRKFGFSRAMLNALGTADVDVFHSHGLWKMPNIYPGHVANKRNRPIILSPHGMLGAEALQFSRIKKQVVWALFQGSVARTASCIHATSEQELGEIRNLGLIQPVAMIPIGIDLPPRPMVVPGQPPFVLSLGRMHPKKALDRLIEAWALVTPAFPDWRLRLVGPSELGYAGRLDQLVRTLGLKSVDIMPPVFGDEKLSLLAAAEIFALTTLNENFGMVVAESLSMGTPVISTKGAPWSDLDAQGCGWWVDHDVGSIAGALSRAMALSGERRQAMGERGRAWMERDFGWDSAARKMVEVYRWLTGAGDMPGCVRVG